MRSTNSFPTTHHLELNYMGFPGSSEGKESSCNAGGLASISGLGRSPGEGNEWLRGATPRLRSGAAVEMSYPTPEVRGGDQEE